MMLINGPSLGILSIMMTILVSTLSMHAQPIKRMKDFDISEEPSSMVTATPSRAFPGGTHYAVGSGYRSRYLIGMVRDGQDVLIEGDPTAVSRYILVQNRQDGMRYIRATTRWRITGSFRNHVDEFVRRPDGYYAPIIRVPIEVDLLTQDIGPYINVELLGNWEEHDRRPGVMPDNIETMSMRFTIQPEVALHAMIGVVRYGHYIVDNNVDGLMSREVVWEGGVEKPIITIVSRYTDGRGTETKYTFIGEDKRLIPYFSRILPVKLNE